MTGGELVVDGLQVAYRRDEPVLDGVGFVVPTGTLTALLGPSGCGKSTLLAVVAGLLRPSGGDVRVDGRSVLDVPAERRPVGMVFQRPLLFAHLDVLDNVAFGLRMRGVGRRERRRRAREALDLVGLGDLADRRVGELSGGQEQRAALARALLPEPPVLLLDEPFAALDPDLRAAMRELVRTVQRETGTTMLFVTHDRTEAVEIADALALLLDRRVEASGTPESFFSDPASLAAARFVGPVNEVPGHLGPDGFRCALGTIPVADTSCPAGAAVLVVRPEHVRLIASDAGRGVVTAVRFHGDRRGVDVDAAGLHLAVHVSPDTTLAPGDVVDVELPSTACRVFPTEAR